MWTHLQIKRRIRMKRLELFLLVQISQKVTRVSRGSLKCLNPLVGQTSRPCFCSAKTAAQMWVKWQPTENYHNKIIGLIREKNCREDDSRQALREENRTETTTDPQQLFFLVKAHSTFLAEPVHVAARRGPSAGPDADGTCVSLGRWWHSPELPVKRGLMMTKPFPLQPCSPPHLTSQ